MGGKAGHFLKIFTRGILKRIDDNSPNQVTLFVTSGCNARCKMCFYWKNIEERKKNELKLEEIKKISKKMQNFTNLLITGGEPFLRNDIDMICETFYKNNNILSIYIPTNGLLPSVIEKKTEEILKKCNNCLITIAISLDGLKEKHEEIRGVKGIFNKVLETFNKLDKLKKGYKNLEININFTYQNSNRNDLGKVYDFVDKNLKGSNFTITLVRGDPRTNKSKKVDMKEYSRYSNEINKKIFKKGKLRFNSIFSSIISARMSLSRKIIYEIQKTKQMPLECLASRFSIVISEEGMVYPCEMIPIPLGSLREYDYDIKKILELKSTKDRIRSIKNKECYCTHECYIPNSILFTPKGLFLLIKEWLNLKKG